MQIEITQEDGPTQVIEVEVETPQIDVLIAETQTLEITTGPRGPAGPKGDPGDLADAENLPVATEIADEDFLIGRDTDADQEKLFPASQLLAAEAGLTFGSYRNLLLHTSELDDDPWHTHAQLAVDADAATSPSGETDAFRLRGVADGVFSRLHQQVDLEENTDYFASIHIAPDTVDWVRLFMVGFGTGLSASLRYAWFDVRNEVVGTAASNVLDTLILASSNGFYRIGVQVNSGSGAPTESIGILVQPVTANDDTDTDTGEAVFAWGAQVETGGFTDYQPRFHL